MLTRVIVTDPLPKVILTKKAILKVIDHTRLQNLIPLEVITIQEEVLQKVVETVEVLDLLAQTIEV